MEYKDELWIKHNIETIKRGNPTRFLDEKERYILESVLRKNKIIYSILKPFETATGTIIYKDREPPISLIKAKNEHFTHSDVLGAYFSLGLDKSLIGDIILQGDSIYITVLKNYENYLIDNFVQIKNEFVTFEKTDWIPLSYQFEEITLFASSNRIDVVLCKLLKISRNKGNELFNKKEVYLNYENGINRIKLKKNNVFSIRKHGKYIVEEIIEYKNKYKIVLKKYI